MSDGTRPDLPVLSDPILLEGLAADLEELDYTVDGVAELMGAAANDALDRGQPVPALLRTRELLDDGTNPLAAVVHLWLLGQTVDAEQLTAAWPRTGVAGAAELGLVEEYDGGWRAAVDLRPYSADDDAGLWIASDLGSDQRPGVLRRDHVLGVGEASLSLAQSIVRRDVDRCLDLGTGCGIQIFHLLRHVRHIVATDISERALAFARFNLILNAAALGLDPHRLEDRVDLRLGSLLEPVGDEQFDLVVSNPPFVITPRRDAESAGDQFVYRDGGLPGDDIVSTLVRDLPGVLKPGGVLQMLGNWEIQDDAAWHTRIESWLSNGTDAWFIQREEIAPEEYAETWLRDASEDREEEAYLQSYTDYLTDFASRDVAAIGFGFVWLRRGTGLDNSGPDGKLRRFEEITHQIEQPVAPAIAAGIDRYDWLAAQSDDDLLQEHLEVAEDVTEERHQRPGAQDPGVILLRQGAGLRRTTLLSSELAGFVSVCDGELAAGQIITALGALLEREDQEFGDQLLADVRNLIADGFLLPAAA
ncbi:DUF7059 domain-containing protein [Arthrobacter sp. H14]|uniref:DUF7059 domain-containing protein n=1 Tax=Arthrobacter sp. H14 TaxID=1312959 RepID=UPI0004BC6267|nr:methyltransferase [Arthrobacter sp. H14]